MAWIKSKFSGVRYREHPTRKHGAVPDRYYTIFYKLDGRMIQEVLGWASEAWDEVDADGQKKRVNWTEKRVAAVLAELKKNQSLGTGPRTLKEKKIEQAAAQAALLAEGLTVAQFWEQDYRHSLQARIKSSSWKKEVSHFEHRINPLIGNKPLKAVTVEDIERIVDRMRNEKLTPRTQQYAIGTFFRIWKHAAKRKLVKAGDNPAADVRVERVNNTRLRIISPNELKDILAHVAASDIAGYEIVVFCAYTGCRFSEAANLTWEYVDLSREAALFYETKNKDSRQVYLAPEIMAFLKKRAFGITGQRVFTKKDGTAYRDPPKSFTTAVKRLGLNKDRGPRDRVTFHSLRHTAATIAARHGVPVKDMQILFGWKTPAMVFRYAKGNEDIQRQAMKGLAHALSEDSTKIIPLIEASGI
jgi:integrase